MHNYLSVSKNFSVHLNLLPMYSCRSLLLTFGIWDEIRVDMGKEWYLMLYAQEMLATKRSDCTRPPHVQSTSRQVIYN